MAARTASLNTGKRAGVMLGKALLLPKKRPDAVDALDHADIITGTI